jgi:2-oxoglutarate ferredoxin oxidoreductase subunit gamma
MLFELVAAGFGGQGILFLGNAIAEAALREGLQATYLPTYGVAMRGGTANCVVTVSDDDIGSPLLDHPHCTIVMNEPSLLKFGPMVRQGGLIVANTSIISPERLDNVADARTVAIPATETARDVAGTERAANIVALGAFLRTEPLVAAASVEAVLSEGIPADKQDMIEKNLAALRAGLEYAPA